MEGLEVERFQSEDRRADDHKPELPEILQQPEINLDGSNEPGKWSSGLFACCNNPCNALVSVLLPCVTFGQVAEMVDEGNIACCISAMLYLASMGVCCIGSIVYLVSFCSISRCLPCKLSSNYRTKLRAKFNIPESPAPDLVTHYCCECCALCQEYRELQSRGFDPSLGWKKNEARNKIRNQQQTMKPPLNQRMMN